MVFGLPRTQPFGRPLDLEEPGDVRIEDLDHYGNPNTWLKFGRFTHAPATQDAESDLYIDTETQKVYMYVLRTHQKLDEWSSLDECLCDLFQRASKYGEEYFFVPKKK